ncbi:MAG TPA: FKBP-type peptidyl-prolyl cis-trans isomerase [Thermoanaerobaculia bacterium]|jgi:peptidylprolyl isomerase
MKRILPLLLVAALPLFAAPKKLAPPTPPADLTAAPADAERFENGLATKVLVKGNGTEHMPENGTVQVRYTVWKSDGSLVQHLVRPQSLMISKAKMIPGWGLAVQKMVIGETRRAWIPHTLGAGKIKEGELLVIDTELLDIIETPTVPPDVAAVPADAKVTPSGLAYKVLRPGSGTVHPTRDSTVVVHYSGWTTDGNMFDSSINRAETAEFPLEGVIKGWTEGLQLMVTGEKTRFWIPAKLAYAHDRKKPQGMLVFDITLVDIAE